MRRVALGLSLSVAALVLGACAAHPPIEPAGTGADPVTFKMQVHYHNLRPAAERDRTAIGVHFASPPFDRRLGVIKVHRRSFWIPAGAARHAVTVRAGESRPLHR